MFYKNQKYGLEFGLSRTHMNSVCRLSISSVRQLPIFLKNIIYKNIEAHIVCWSFSHTKNILRICEADICQKVKNTEPQTKKHYSYKKKKRVAPKVS